MNNIFNKSKHSETKWLSETIQEEIAEKTGFNESKINLILSKRNDSDIPIINYHEFEYEGKLYTLIDNELKCFKQ